MARLTYDNGLQSITLTGQELFRLNRGDQVEIAERIPSPVAVTRVICESPQSADMLQDLRFSLRKVERDLAVAISDAAESYTWRDGGSVCCVIPTVGDSCLRLCRLLSAMHAGCTKHGIGVVVADDGAGFESDKHRIVRNFNCGYHLRTGHAPGIAGNLNDVMADIKGYRWLIIVDDGSLPHAGWADETVRAIACLEAPAAGRSVVLAGQSHIQDWQMSLGGRVPGKWVVNDWFYKPIELVDQMCRKFFAEFSGAHHCIWEDLCGAISKQSDNESFPIEIRDMVRYNHLQAIDCDCNAVERQVREQKYFAFNRWPAPSKPLRVSWSPGSQGLLIRTDFLSEAGGFADDCYNYEMLLALRAAEMGHWSVFFDGPPWLHMPSLGFEELRTSDIKDRVHREIYDVCQSRWGQRDPQHILLAWRQGFADQEPEADLELSERYRVNTGGIHG